jgi:molecular chaperone Hsp33
MIASDGSCLCHCLDSTDMVAEAEQIHQTSAVVTAALGRLMTATSIMGSVLKGEDSSVTVRIGGKGPVGVVIAVADNQGNVRGYVTNPVVELPLNQHGKLDVKGAVGTDGFLSVIKDFGFGEPYVGQVPIVSGEIAEDVTNYYAVSEQLPTVCALGVLVNPDLTVRAAGGYVAQLLPGADDASIDRLEKTIQEMPPISQMIDQKMTPQEIAERVLQGFEPELLSEQQVEYRCNCSRDRVERAFLSMSREDLAEMANDTKDTEVSCHFCNKTYSFTPDQLKKLLAEQ